MLTSSSFSTVLRLGSGTLTLSSSTNRTRVHGGWAAPDAGTQGPGVTSQPPGAVQASGRVCPRLPTHLHAPRAPPWVTSPSLCSVPAPCQLSRCGRSCVSTFHSHAEKPPASFEGVRPSAQRADWATSPQPPRDASFQATWPLSQEMFSKQIFPAFLPFIHLSLSSFPH